MMFLTPFGNNIGSWSASIESISSRPMVCSRIGALLAKEMFGVSSSGLCFHVVDITVELALVEELSGLLRLDAGRTCRRRIGKLKRIAKISRPLTNLPILAA